MRETASLRLARTGRPSRLRHRADRPRAGGSQGQQHGRRRPRRDDDGRRGHRAPADRALHVKASRAASRDAGPLAAGRAGVGQAVPPRDAADSSSGPHASTSGSRHPQRDTADLRRAVCRVRRSRCGCSSTPCRHAPPCCWGRREAGPRTRSRRALAGGAMPDAGPADARAESMPVAALAALNACGLPLPRPRNDEPQTEHTRESGRRRKHCSRTTAESETPRDPPAPERGRDPHDRVCLTGVPTVFLLWFASVPPVACDDECPPVVLLGDSVIARSGARAPRYAVLLVDVEPRHDERAARPNAGARGRRRGERAACRSGSRSRGPRVRASSW